MFCTNCGTKLEDGQRFCSNCGARVGGADPAPAKPVEPVEPFIQPDPAPAPDPTPAPAPAEPAAPYQPVYRPTPNPQPAYTSARPIQPSQPKKKKGWVVPVVIIAVVLVLAIAAAALLALRAGGFSNLIAKTFSAPDEYYRRVERDGVDRLLESGDEVELTRGMFSDHKYFENKMMLSFNESALSGEILDLIEDEIGVDVSWFHNVGAYLSMGSEDKLIGGSSTLFLNDTDIIDADYVMDNESNKLFYRIPLLSSNYVEIDAGEYTAGTNNEAAAAGQELYELLSDGETVRILIDRYSEIVINDLTKVEKGSREFTVNGITKSFDAYEVTIDGEVALQLAKDVLSKARSDAELEKLALVILKAQGYSEDQANEEILNSLEDYDDALERLEKKKPEDVTKSVLMTVCVDNRGRIVAREIKLFDDGKLEGEFSYVLLTKGTDFGLRAYAYYREEYGQYADEYSFTLDGGGELKLNASVSGQFEFYVVYSSDWGGTTEKTDLKALDLSFEASYKDKALSYSVSAVPTKELFDLALEDSSDYVPDSVIKLIRSLSAELRGDIKGSSANSSLTVKVGSKDLLGFSLEAYPVEEFELRTPRNTVTPDEWAYNIDYSALYAIGQKLSEAGVPASLLNNLF